MDELIPRGSKKRNAIGNELCVDLLSQLFLGNVFSCCDILLWKYASLVTNRFSALYVMCMGKKLRMMKYGNKH